jgi:hypothetical protein
MSTEENKWIPQDKIEDWDYSHRVHRKRHWQTFYYHMRKYPLMTNGIRLVAEAPTEQCDNAERDPFHIEIFDYDEDMDEHERVVIFFSPSEFDTLIIMLQKLRDQYREATPHVTKVDGKPPA